jgi:hypothetical protein
MRRMSVGTATAGFLEILPDAAMMVLLMFAENLLKHFIDVL